MDDIDTGSLAQSLKGEINEDWTASSSWREEAREWYRFVHNHQWTKEEERILRDANREWFSFNRIGPALRFIAGEEIKNRREIRFKPRTIEDTSTAEAYSAAAEFYRDKVNAERMESLALQDNLTCGLGYVEDRVDYLDDPDGCIIFEKLDPFEVVHDRNSTAHNLSDARRITRIRRIVLEEAREMFPDFEDDDLDAGTWFIGRDSDTKQGNLGTTGGSSTIGANEARSVSGSVMVSIAEVQYWRRENMVRLGLPGRADPLEMRRDAFDALAEKLGMAGVMPSHQKFKKKVFYQAFIGSEMLEHSLSPCQVGFTIKAMTGYRDRETGMWYGIVRDLMDPQRFQNRLLTTSAHILKTTAKGGVMYDRRLVGDDVRDFEYDYARADSAIGLDALHDSNGNPAVMPKPATPFPPAVSFLTELTNASFDWVTGMSAEARGQSDAVIPADLGWQRRQTAMTVLQDLFDSVRAYRINQGESLLYYIRMHIADGRLIRIFGKDKEELVKLVRSPESAKYDVVIDDSPTSPNEKERQWPIIERILGLFGQTPPPGLIVEALNYSPLNASLVAKARQHLEESKPDPQEQKLQQAAAAKALQLTITQAELENARAELGLAEIRAKIRKTTAEAASIEMQAAPEASADQARADLDRARAEAFGKSREAMAGADIAESRARAERIRAASAEDSAQINRLLAEIDMRGKAQRHADDAEMRRLRLNNLRAAGQTTGAR